MDVTLPKTFYGGGFAVSAIFVLASYFGNVDENLRYFGIFIAIVLFFAMIGVFYWDQKRPRFMR